MALVRKEFFPPSTRPELIVELTLPTGASIHATDKEMKRITDMLKQDPDVLNVSGYVAQSAPRFVLVQDSSMAADNYGQLIVMTDGAAERDRLAKKLEPNGLPSSLMCVSIPKSCPTTAVGIPGDAEGGRRKA